MHHQMKGVQDDSNQESKITRNFINTDEACKKTKHLKNFEPRWNSDLEINYRINIF